MIAGQPIIQVIEGKDLSPKQYGEILALCSLAYGTDYEPPLSSFNDPSHILAYADEVLVSHALWITRWLQYNHNLMLRAAYVEAVATHPAFRFQGLGKAVMRAIQANILDFDLGCLCPSDTRWYSRLGWERWEGPLFIRTANGLVATTEEQVMIFRFPHTPELDLKAPLSAEWREGELW